MKRSRLARDIVGFADTASARIRVFSWNVSWESTKPSHTNFGELGARAREDVHGVRGAILRIVDSEDADIVALQETPIEWRSDLTDHFTRSGYDVHFLYDSSRFGPEGMFTAWKRGLFPNTTPMVLEGSFEGHRGRPLTTIDFGTELVVVNLHAGHDYRLDRFTGKLSNLKGRRRVIVCGDFNRPVKLLAFGRKQLRLRNCQLSDTLMTCCAVDDGQAHEYSFDHVLTDLTVYVPTRIVAREFPTSDHLPISADVLLPPLVSGR